MIGVAVGLVATTLSGYAVLRPLLRSVSRSERFAWSLAAGLIFQAVLTLVLVVIFPGSDLSAPLALLTALSLTPLLRRGRSTEPKPPGAPEVPRTAVALLVVTTLGVALFAVAALSEPMWAVDYLAIWGLKAKTIFLTASMPGRLFYDAATVWSHPEYPLLLPLDLAALAAWARGWDDRALALLYPLCQAATAAAVFGFLARRNRGLGGAIAAGLVSWFIPLYCSPNVGLAEIPFALGVVLLATALLDTLEADSGAARLATASLFCAATKQEGALLSILAAAVWVVFHKPGRRRLQVLVALALPALVMTGASRIVDGQATRRIFDLGLVAPGRWGEWLERLSQAASHIASVEIVAAGIPLSALAGFFLVTRYGPADRLLMLLGGQVLFYVLACSLSVFGVAWHLETSFSRITGALFPALALVLGARVVDPTPSAPEQ